MDLDSNPPNQTPSAPISVLIVEDEVVTRRTLCMAIESEPTLKLAAALDSVRSAVDWLKLGSVDILLTDLGLPDGSGLDVIRACLERNPCCDVMVLTMSSDEDKVLACIEAGASGYILKGAGRLDVVRALLDLHAGGSPMSPLIARKVLSRMRDDKKVPERVAAPGAPNALLTKREAAILDLIARGDTYGEVARLLSVSVGTVQTHVKNIYGKLAVHSRGEAVFEAQRRGLLHLNLLKSRE
jgi:DNA-binding NarL/FixJ family response regulator